MKKITFKNLVTLVLCVLAFQVYAQEVTFQENTPYRFRTAIPSQESYNSKAASNPGEFVYPTVSSEDSRVTLQLREDFASPNQVFRFRALEGETFTYQGFIYQVYNIVGVNVGDGNGTGVMERNDLVAQGQRMRLRGATFPQTEGKFTFILVSNPVSDDNFDVPNAVSIISTAGQPSATTLRRLAATTRFDWLNFGGPSPADASSPWIDSWVLELATNGDQVTQLPEPEAALSNNQFDSSSIFIANPVNNNLSIKGLSDNVNEVSVFSLLGQKVLTRTVNSESTLSIDVSGLVSGVYLVKLKGDNGSFTKKIIKQ